MGPKKGLTENNGREVLEEELRKISVFQPDLCLFAAIIWLWQNTIEMQILNSKSCKNWMCINEKMTNRYTIPEHSMPLLTPYNQLNPDQLKTKVRSC